MTTTDVTTARSRLLEAALHVIEQQIATDHYSDSDWSAEYADEQLAIAARDLVNATEALPRDQRPVGWNKTTT